MKVKSYTFLLSLTAGLGSLISGIFFTAFNASISSILSTLGAHGLMDNIYTAFLSAAIPFGALFGILMATYTSNAIGRRKSMILADIITLFGCLFCLAPLFSVMFLGRLLCGIASGVNALIVPLFMREIRNVHLHKTAAPIVRTMFTFGAFMTFLLAYCLKEPLAGSGIYWRVPYMLPIVFSVARLVAFGHFIKLDTPAYYMMNSDEEKAFSALKKLYPLEGIDDACQYERDAERLARFASTPSHKYDRQGKIIFLLIFVGQFMGANLRFFHSTIIFAGNSGLIREQIDNQGFQNLLLGLSAFLATLIGSQFINKIRRRFTIVYGTLVLTGLCLLIVCSESVDFLIGQTTLIMTFTGLQAFIYGLLLAVYCEELVPAFGISGVVLLEMLFTLITVGALPFIEVRNAFLVFGLVGIVSFVPVFKMIKETRNKTPQDVLKMFNSRRGIGLLDKDLYESDETDVTDISIL